MARRPVTAGSTQAASSTPRATASASRIQCPGRQKRQQIGRRAVEDAVDTGEPAVWQRDAGGAVSLQSPDARMRF